MASTVALVLLLGVPLAAACIVALPWVGGRDKLRASIVVVAVAAQAIGAGSLIAAAGVLGDGRRSALALDLLDPSRPIGGWLWTYAPVALSILFVAIGLRLRSPAIVGLGAASVLLSTAVALGERVPPLAAADASASTLVLDPLAASLVIVAAAIGGLIVIYAIGYEPVHLTHAHLPVARSGPFLAWLLLFLPAMQLLVLADDLRLLAVGWELTTLCSFALIGFDGDPAALVAARRALVYNLGGGIGLGVAGLAAGPGATLSAILATSGAPAYASAAAGGGIAWGGGPLGDSWLAVALGGCIAAAAVKSALIPFQPWLLGAMVAAAPVSALLHASTMVKAGSYLLLRLSPAFSDGSLIGPCLAVLGGLSFALAALLALRERDLKRVLALSTVSGLGLIAASAGLGSPAALAAGTLLLLFHAAAKALAFLAAGSIEQAMGSRDIETLVGAARHAPRVAIPLLIAVAALALPPFGVAAAKWAILELGIRDIALTVLLAVGAAANVALWTAVATRLIVRRAGRAPVVAPVPTSETSVVGALAAGSALAVLAAAPIARALADPAAAATFGISPGIAGGWSILLPGGGFTVPFLALLLAIAAGAGWVVGARIRVVAPAPYLSGATVRRPRRVTRGVRIASASTEFHGPMGEAIVARSGGFHWGADVRPARGPGPYLLGWLAAALVLGATFATAIGSIVTGGVMR
jgi:ech hydrogenase subunit A